MNRLTDEQLGEGQLRLLRDLDATPRVKVRKQRHWRMDLLHQLLVDRVRSGHYHDFLGPLDAPKTRLHEDLADIGYYELAGNCIEGRYDDERPPAAATPIRQERLNLVGVAPVSWRPCGGGRKAGPR